MKFDWMQPLREKYPNTKFLLKFFTYLSVFSPNAGKYGPEKTPYLDTFHTVSTYNNIFVTIMIMYLQQWNIIHNFF